MILVTGATGLLGSQLIRELTKQGDGPIRAIKRANSSLKFIADIQDQIEWVETDILDIIGLNDALQGVKHVYHCAAVVSFDPKRRDELWQTNVEGTANVVNLCLDNKVEKLAFVSSIAALGRAKEGNSINEKQEWEDSNQNSWYAVTKYNAEQEVWRGVAEGLDAVIVNPSIILGPGNWKTDSSAFFNIIEKGMPFYPIGQNGFVDVLDVARSLVNLMKSDIKNERFVLNGGDVKYKDLFDTIANKIGKSPTKTAITPLIGAIGWRLEKVRAFLKGKTPVITKETVRTTSKNYSYSSKKLKDAIGYEFIPMKESIDRIGDQYLAETR